MLSRKFIIKEEEAMAARSRTSSVPLTNLTCAFFSNEVLVASKMVVTTRNSAQVPICGFDRYLTSNMKLISPNRVTEKRCKNVKKAERIQYDERYFFKRGYVYQK
jgi:hypothetical protein